MRRSLESRAEANGSDAASIRDSIRIVVPERLVLDEIARERLVRALLTAPAPIAAVGGELATIEPGASYRVDAEWRSVTGGPLRPAPTGSVRGAVALRPGTDYTVHDDTVTVAGADVLVDPGAVAFDPHAPGEPGPATPRGRSPFPRRPVVCFLGLEPDPEREDWARRMVNRLVRRDVEARLLTPTGAPGAFHLTRPATPDAASIAALEPDVVVALDPDALRLGPRWCTRRETTLIAFDPEHTESVELISWEITRAQGRLRARIGYRVDAPTLVGLVLRLCAGPQPVAPRDRPTRAAALTTTAPLARRTFVIAATESARALGLVDAFAAAGFDPDLTIANEHVPGSAADADLVVIGGAVDPETVAELVAERTRAGRPTVCDLTAAELAADDPTAIAESAATLARACGLVAAGPGPVAIAATELGLPVLELVTMPTRRRTAALVAARRAHDPLATIIGWRPPPADPATTDAAATAVARLLDAHAGLEVEIADGEPPAALARSARVRVVGPDVEAAVIAGWRVHLWTPRLVDGIPADDQLAVREAALAGVPTASPLTARAAIVGFAADALTATDPTSADDWTAVLGHLIEHPDARAFLARAVVRRARAVYGPVWWKLAANRLVGWATGPGAPEAP